MGILKNQASFCRLKVPSLRSLEFGVFISPSVHLHAFAFKVFVFPCFALLTRSLPVALVSDVFEFGKLL